MMRIPTASVYLLTISDELQLQNCMRFTVTVTYSSYSSIQSAEATGLRRLGGSLSKDLILLLAGPKLTETFGPPPPTPSITGSCPSAALRQAEAGGVSSKLHTITEDYHCKHFYTIAYSYNICHYLHLHIDRQLGGQIDRQTNR